MNKLSFAPSLAIFVMAASAAIAQVSPQLPKVEGAWVRSSVPGQHGTGGFMRITAREPMQLVGVATPVAGVAEIHEMKMEGDVMRMRAVEKIELAPGKALELKPGGYHLMLMDLKQALKKDSVIPLTLVFRNAAGARVQMQLQVPVATQRPGSAPGAPSEAHKH